MIALSNHRDFSASPEVAENQLKAKATWNPIFSKIIYTSPCEPQLCHENTYFLFLVNEKTCPKIKELCYLAGQIESAYVVILNADIQLSPKTAQLEYYLQRVKADCGISLRFTPGDTSRVQDLGLDFFVARPVAWARIADLFPEEYELGHILWDTSMLAHFTNLYPETCYDITRSRLVFHPLHKSRGDQTMTVPASDQFYHKVAWPKKKLSY